MVINKRTQFKDKNIKDLISLTSKLLKTLSDITGGLSKWLNVILTNIYTRLQSNFQDSVIKTTVNTDVTSNTYNFYSKLHQSDLILYNLHLYNI